LKRKENKGRRLGRKMEKEGDRGSKREEEKRHMGKREKDCGCMGKSSELRVTDTKYTFTPICSKMQQLAVQFLGGTFAGKSVL
jgi:hypothetical protein